MTPRAMSAGVLRLLAGTPMPNRSKGRDQTKSDPLVLQVWGLGRGLITHSRKKMYIIETKNRGNLLNFGYAVTTHYNNGEPMTHEGQSQQDALRLNKSLLQPKNTTNIGNWNVRTLYQSGNIAQAAREMVKRDIDIMGISETHWTGQGKLQLPRGETIIYSGREDDIHREGVGILMSKSAAKALMDWQGLAMTTTTMKE